jgi:hypothetical protein
MANPNTPSGLVPVRYLSGATYNGATNAYSCPASDATQILLGDPVALVGTASTINGQIVPDIRRAATGDVVVGTLQSVEPITHESPIYREASVLRMCNVADDPNLVFVVQEASGGTPVAANDIGLNANFVVAAGSTFTGLSGVQLNNTTQATTATLDLKIVGFNNVANNAVGANAKWLVRLNRHQYVNQVVGV